tara:strand:+ start:556 stop:1302 length:747 start_codon:yes stop_codon:yes gene_type:complete
MTNLRDWKSSKFDDYRAKVKAQVAEGIDVNTDTIIDEDTLQEIHDEVAIERFAETVEFDYEITLDEALETDLNDTICDCPEDDEDCSCPEMYYDFIPDEFGELMDVEFEIDGMSDHYDDGVNNYLKIKDAMFADSFDLVDQDLPENADDPLEHGMTTFDEAQPGRARVIFRRAKGRITKRKRCPKGTRLQGNRCIPQTGTQKARLRRTGIKLKRAKRAMGAGKKKLAALKSRITKKRVKTRSRNYAGT